MEPHTAGDPISGLKWTHKTTQKISDELRKVDIRVCPKTVGRLLRGLKFSLRVNHKKVAGQSSPYRNQQFEYINRTRARFERQGWPAISIDTKKRELVGLFKNPGELATHPGVGQRPRLQNRRHRHCHSLGAL